MSFFFYKAEVQKPLLGTGKFDSDDDSEGKGTISENGVISTDSDDKDILIAKPLKEYLVNKSGKVDNDKVQKNLLKYRSLLSHMVFRLRVLNNDIYHDAGKSYYFAVVDGGKRIVILEDSYGDLYSKVILKDKTKINHDTSSR